MHWGFVCVCKFSVQLVISQLGHLGQADWTNLFFLFPSCLDLHVDSHLVWGVVTAWLGLLPQLPGKR